jgi:hypothetical protein
MFIIFEVLKVVKVHIVVSCVTTACIPVGANKCFRGTHCFQFQGI